MRETLSPPDLENKDAAVISSGISNLTGGQTKAAEEKTNLLTGVNSNVVPFGSSPDQVLTRNKPLRAADRYFFPMWLNEAGLSRGEFRIYYAIACRCNFKTGVAWPSGATIAKDSGYKWPKAIWPYLKSLIDKGLIERVKRPGTSNCYRASRGFTQSEKRTDTQSEKRTTHLVRKTDYECREGNVKKEVCVSPAPNHTHPQSFSLTLTDPQASDAKNRLSISDQELVLLREDFSILKVTYPTQRSFDRFLSEYLTRPTGIKFLANLKAKRPAGSDAPRVRAAKVNLPEPEGWMQEEAFEGSEQLKTPWAEKTLNDQNTILEAVRYHQQARLRAMSMA